MEESCTPGHSLQHHARQTEPHIVRERRVERRLRRRYELDLDMRYRSLREDSLVSGKVRDMSSKAICFMASKSLSQGTMVELSIDWPVLLFDTRALQLKVKGCVVRSGEQETAVSIMWYEFRTRKTQPEAVTPGPRPLGVQ